MKNIDLKNVIWKEGRHFVALNLNTNVSSFAGTRTKALESLEEALELYFEDIPHSQVSHVEDPAIVGTTFEHA